jgi:hypothetical protein
MSLVADRPLRISVITHAKVRVPPDDVAKRGKVGAAGTRKD